MTNIDRQALVEATAGFHNQRDSEWSDLDDCIYAAIEAYEAARPEPNPWRPIAEAPRDGSWILVLVDDYTFPPGMIQWNGDAWVDNDLDCWDLDFLLRERAMFRTIDPPKQDVAQSAVDSAPAAGTG